MDLQFERFLNKYFGSLNEALEFSYDVQKLKKHLQYKFQDKVKSVVIDLVPSATYETKKFKTGTPATLTLIVSTFQKEDREQLDKILEFFGYYIAKEFKEGLYIGYQIEPKHGVLFEPRQWNIAKMYHITPTKNVKSILDKGLLYNQTQTDYEHPGDRIFLFWTKSSEVLYQWAKRLGLSKGTNEISILQIDLEPYYKIYLDDTATLKDIRKDFQSLLAVYTTSAISPTNIKLVKDLEFLRRNN
jgi:hypothetical protein